MRRTTRTIGVLGAALVIMTACFGGPTATAADGETAGATALTADPNEIALTMSQTGRLYAVGSIEGLAGPFWIDPWAAISRLTPDTVLRLQRRIKDGMVKSPPIRLGGTVLPVDLMTVDSHVAEIALREDGMRPLGLIGQDLLATTVVEFDPDRHVLRLGTPLGAETAGDDILTFAGKDPRLPIVEVRIHEATLRLLLDPSSEGVLLAYDAARQCGMVASATMDLTMIWQNRAATMPVFGQHLYVGPISRTAQMVQVLPPHTPMPAEPDVATAGYDGLLGMRTLTTHRVIIDFLRQRVVLRPR